MLMSDFKKNSSKCVTHSRAMMLTCFLTADDVSSPAVQQELPDVAASWCYVNPCSPEITLTVTWVQAQDSRFAKEGRGFFFLLIVFA